ncbi:MAG: hypothetical protein PHC83_04675 [Bacteroidales bacterium]|jgi:hypothetical protein|nr:hypothetical protein [Bacteroidales bacterium]MDD4208815.1 hypothetical protein [Bacteroidales bacterium]MDY0015179.1 hypothetical protein [Bacteroidales bacterium]
MKTYAILLLLCGFLFISCEEHVCTCKEYKEDAIIKEYEKSINNPLMCEEFNTEKVCDEDTIFVICGEKNPL